MNVRGPLALVLTLALTGAAGATSLKLGVAVPRTTNLVQLGNEQAIAINKAVAHFNARGGVNGVPVEAVFQDAGGDQVSAVLAVKRLIETDQVLGIVGPSYSTQMIAAAPIIDKSRVPTLGPSTTAKGIAQLSDFIARVSAPAQQQGLNALKTILKRQPTLKTVAVLFAEDDAYSRSEGESMRENAAALGLRVVASLPHKVGDTAFDAHAREVLASNPDLIVVSGLSEDGARIVKALRTAGFKGTVMGGNAMNTPNIFFSCGRSCDGLILGQSYDPQDTARNAANATFVKLYGGSVPTPFAAQAFTAVQVFVEAMKRAEKTLGRPLATVALPEARAAINAAMLNRSYVTPLGVIRIDKEGEIVQKNFYTISVKMSSETQGRFDVIR